MMVSCKSFWVALALLLLAALASATNGAKLSARYYDKTCPNVQNVVREVMAHKVAGEPWLAPAVLRLFFHDCFVNVRDYYLKRTLKSYILLLIYPFASELRN